MVSSEIKRQVAGKENLRLRHTIVSSFYKFFISNIQASELSQQVWVCVLENISYHPSF